MGLENSEMRGLAKVLGREAIGLAPGARWPCGGAAGAGSQSEGLYAEVRDMLQEALEGELGGTPESRGPVPGGRDPSASPSPGTPA